MLMVQVYTYHKEVNQCQNLKSAEENIYSDTKLQSSKQPLQPVVGSGLTRRFASSSPHAVEYEGPDWGSTGLSVLQGLGKLRGQHHLQVSPD